MCHSDPFPTHKGYQGRRRHWESGTGDPLESLERVMRSLHWVRTGNVFW